MTELKSESTQTVPPVAPKKNTAADAAAGLPRATNPGAVKSRRSFVLAFGFVVSLILALALVGVLWYQHQYFKETNTVLARQIQAGAEAARTAGDQAQQAWSLARKQSGQIAAMQVLMDDAQNHYENLEQAFQTLTDSGSDLVLVNDVDHLVTNAHQQLLLGGNVGNAIIALETAQAQLARANRSTLASLQQSINGDLDHLRATSTIDIAVLSAQLEELSRLVGQAPLLVPDHAAPAVAARAAKAASTGNAGNAGNVDTIRPAGAPDLNTPGWRKPIDAAADWLVRAWFSIRQDLDQFISVRRVEDTASLLMSPEQAAQLRENLRLRVMTAQLALMMHQPKVWQAETQKLVQALATRYDGLSPDTQRALKLARQLADTSIDIKLPTVDNSLKAIETLRESSAKAAQQQDGVGVSSESVPDDSVSAEKSTPVQPQAAGTSPPAGSAAPPAPIHVPDPATPPHAGADTPAQAQASANDQEPPSSTAPDQNPASTGSQSSSSGTAQ